MDETKDSNGKILSEGDSVRLTKDLKAKGSSMNLKRGEVIKKIRLIPGDVENVECKMGKSTIVVKTCFLVKA
jgi:protein PhnA